MSHNGTDKRDEKGEEHFQQLQQQVRKYAQNRTVPVLLSLGVFTLLFVAISQSSRLAGVAWRSGRTTLTVISLVLPAAISLAALIFFSVPSWGGRLIERLSRRIYGNSGIAILKPRLNPRLQRSLGYALGFVFGACVLGSVALGQAGYLPLKYMQPISAIYVVPFLVLLFILMRPAAGWIALLWPVLYALHALLIVAGVPIVFSGGRVLLNMLIPTLGYGLLSAGIAHIYSRVVLRRLRKAVREGMGGSQVIINTNSTEGQ